VEKNRGGVAAAGAPRKKWNRRTDGNVEPPGQKERRLAKECEAKNWSAEEARQQNLKPRTSPEESKKINHESRSFLEE